jgi:hypothetical protein
MTDPEVAVIITKLDHISAQQSEMREEHKGLVQRVDDFLQSHHALEGRLGVLEERVNGHRILLMWLAGIVATTIASILSALGIQVLHK